MNIRHNEVLREKLASEYVLGTLKWGARRRFESWLRDDAGLRRSVAEWQERLCPLAEFSPAVAPPAHIWSAIETRIDAQAKPAREKFWPRWIDSINFWRGLGVASTAIATVLVAVLLVRQPVTDVATPTYVALLSDSQAHAAMMIIGDATRRELIVKVMAPQNIADDKSLELWALPKDGTPRSLGLVAANGTVTLPLPASMLTPSIPALAISLEPKGGSPNPDAPSGPVLFKGAWGQV